MNICNSVEAVWVLEADNEQISFLDRWVENSRNVSCEEWLLLLLFAAHTTNFRVTVRSHIKTGWIIVWSGLMMVYLEGGYDVSWERVGWSQRVFLEQRLVHSFSFGSCQEKHGFYLRSWSSRRLSHRVNSGCDLFLKSYRLLADTQLGHGTDLRVTGIESRNVAVRILQTITGTRWNRNV